MPAGMGVPDARLLNGGLNTGSAVTTTGALTPTSTNLKGLYFFYAFASSGAAFTDTTTLSGAGVTWAKIASDISGNNHAVAFIGYGDVVASGALTLTFSRTPTSGRFFCMQVPGGIFTTNPDVGTSVVARGSGTAGAAAYTKAQFGSWTYSAWFHAANEATTPDATSGAGWAEAYDGASASGSVEHQYTSGMDTQADATWATSSAWVGIVHHIDPYDADTVAEYVHEPDLHLDTFEGDVFPDDSEEDPEGVWAVVG